MSINSKFIQDVLNHISKHGNIKSNQKPIKKILKEIRPLLMCDSSLIKKELDKVTGRIKKIHDSKETFFVNNTSAYPNGKKAYAAYFQIMELSKSNRQAELMAYLQDESLLINKINSVCLINFTPSK